MRSIEVLIIVAIVLISCGQPDRKKEPETINKIMTAKSAADDVVEAFKNINSDQERLVDSLSLEIEAKLDALARDDRQVIDSL